MGVRRRAALRRAGSRVVAMCVVAAGAAGIAVTAMAEEGCSEDSAKPSAENPIVIGVSLALSKDLGSFGGPLRDAVRAAEGEINAGGGLLGRQLKFDIVDDRSDEGEGMIKIARDFADRGVAAMIGPLSSGQVKASHQIFADKRIVQITPAATSVELNDVQPQTDRFLFRTTPADDFQGAAVILFATKTPKGLGDAGVPMDDAGAPLTCNRLALVFIDNAYGNSMAKVVLDNFPKRGVGRSIVSKKIPLEAASSYAPDVAGIIGTDPECLALITYEKAAAQFIKDLKANPGYAALEKKGFFIIGTDGVFTQGFLDLSCTDQANDTSASSAEGVYGTNPDTQPRTSEYNGFRTIYGSDFPLKPLDDAPVFAANTFDAAILVAFAIQKVGKIDDRVAIREALKEVSRPPGRPISPSEISEALRELREGRDIDYKGASGDVNFQDNGNVTSGFIVWQAVRNAQSNKVVYKTVAHFDSDVLLEQIK